MKKSGYRKKLASLLRGWRRIVHNWIDYPLRDGILWAGRYRIDRFLGMGSYGLAYACTDISDGSRLLLKLNKPSKRDLGRELLRRESAVLRSLAHPQIPRWLGYLERGKEEGLLMELVDGANVEELIHGEGRVYTEREALALLRALLRPLGHLHEAGYVHRDVRIPNVLDRQGAVYLIDFGLACRIGEELPADLKEGLGELGGSSDTPDAGGGWPEARRKMRRPYPSSDLQGAGHLFLFLMYAGYSYEEGQAERSWEEELTLTPAARTLVRRLLQADEDGGLTAAGCVRELDRLLDGPAGP